MKTVDEMVELFPFRDYLIASETECSDMWYPQLNVTPGNKFIIAYQFENGYGISILGCDNCRVNGIYSLGGNDSFEVAMFYYYSSEPSGWLVKGVLNRNDVVRGYCTRDEVEKIMVFIKNYKQGDIYG